ncbi:MAG TPA: M1 family peptidase, partial [Ferruginibacter sp.]|nr:M1 family peptidase [Ferruginibacter sp.]
MRLFILIIIGFLMQHSITAQDIRNNPGSNHGNRFEQLGTILPTPNAYRTASGAPGPQYWQQRADYDITCELDETERKLTGVETITYTNNSPDVLTYLWLQLDENQHSTVNNAGYQTSNTSPGSVSPSDLERMTAPREKEHGHQIT